MALKKGGLGSFDSTRDHVIEPLTHRNYIDQIVASQRGKPHPQREVFGLELHRSCVSVLFWRCSSMVVDCSVYLSVCQVCEIKRAQNLQDLPAPATQELAWLS